MEFAEVMAKDIDMVVATMRRIKDVAPNSKSELPQS